MRLDLKLVQAWIRPDCQLLDLGCGDGSLLQGLREHKSVNGYGVEIDPDFITECIRKDVNVIEQDLNKGLSNFPSDSFDTVVMAQALQTLRHPDKVLEEILRIGKECIVTFPNFGHWRCRWQLSQVGKMPVSKFMPYSWYDTPNIHFCTVKDFEALCRERNIKVLDRTMVGNDNSHSWLADRWPNLFGVTAIYHISN